MKILIPFWALVVSAATEDVRDIRDVGISSGYGGAYGYVQIPSVNDFKINLQPSVVISNGYDKHKVPLKKVIDSNLNMRTNAAISSGYGGLYGYAEIPTVNNIKINLQPSLVISNGYDRNNVPLEKVVDTDIYLQSNAAISSGYAGAQAPNVVNVDKNLQPSVVFSSAYGSAFGYGPTLSTSRTNKGLPSNVVFSNGYDRIFSYSPIESVASGANSLQPGVAISSGYGGAYGYDSIPTSSVNKIINVQKMIDMTLEMNMRQMDAPQEMLLITMIAALRSSPGYSGYGSSINSYSGYSRYPGHAGYGFAYANGWL